MFNHIVSDRLAQWPTLADGHCVPKLYVPMVTDKNIVNKNAYKINIYIACITTCVLLITMMVKYCIGGNFLSMKILVITSFQIFTNKLSWYVQALSTIITVNVEKFAGPNFRSSKEYCQVFCEYLLI